MADRKTLTLSLEMLEQLCPADLYEMEQATGKRFGSLVALTRDVEQMDAQALWAFAFLQLRRDDPEVTWDQAGQYYVQFEVERDPKVDGSSAPPSMSPDVRNGSGLPVSV